MKKLFLFLVISAFAFQIAQAQLVKTGDNAINAGLGFGGILYKGNGLPSLNFSYETLPLQKLGIGYIGVGGYASYKYTSHSYYYAPAHDYKVKYNYWIVAGRAAYHFDFYAMNHNDFFRYFDVYAGVLAGLGFANNNYSGDYNISVEKDTQFVHDVFAGCRYQFSDALTLYAEASYDVSLLSFGVSFLF